MIRRPEFSDEGIWLAGKITCSAIAGLGLPLALSVSGPADESPVWRTAGFAFPYLTPAALVIAISARIAGRSREWVPAVVVLLLAALVGLAIHATEVRTLTGGLETGAWGFLWAAVVHLPFLCLLFALGTAWKSAAKAGLAVALFAAVGGVALAFHDVSENEFWSGGWVFLAPSHSHLAAAFVLAAACLVQLEGVSSRWLRSAGMLVAMALLVSGGAYGLWFMDRLPQDRGWWLSLQWTPVVSLAVLVLVATDALRRFDVMAVAAVGLVVASIANATWIAQRAEMNQAQAFLSIGLSLITPVALIVFWWLLNERSGCRMRVQMRVRARLCRRGWRASDTVGLGTALASRA